MYLHIGDNHSIPYKDIVIILNLDVVDSDSPTQEMLNWADWAKKLKKEDIPKKAKSCIITKNKYYFSTISALTLYKRSKKQSFQ